MLGFAFGIRGDPGVEGGIKSRRGPASSDESASSAGLVVDGADETADSREVGSGGIHTTTESGPKPGRKNAEEMAHSRLPSEFRDRIREWGWVERKPKLRASTAVNEMRSELRSKEIVDMVYRLRCGFERLGFGSDGVEIDEEVSKVSNIDCTWTTSSKASKMDAKVKVPGIALAKSSDSFKR